MFTKEFDIRWSDLDANRHLANSAFINFMSHTRMAYLIENGFG
jgi:acyl-CoA thioester hydrolase